MYSEQVFMLFRLRQDRSTVHPVRIQIYVTIWSLSVKPNYENIGFMFWPQDDARVYIKLEKKDFSTTSSETSVQEVIDLWCN